MDSDVVIALLHGRENIRSQWERHLSEGRRMHFSPVTRAEVFAEMRSSEERGTRPLFQLLTSLVITDEIGEVSGYYLAKFGPSHGVELGDALIAATAWAHRVRLWTLNKKHYPMPEISFLDF